jgi:aminopeptidase N
MKKYFLFVFAFLFITCFSQAQLSISNKQVFTKADTLRGSNNENRDWWDVLRYDITVKPDFEKKEIQGTCIITFHSKLDITDEVLEFSKNFPSKRINNANVVEFSYESPSMKDKYMQIDLQDSLEIDLIILLDSFARGKPLSNEKIIIEKENVFVNFSKQNGVYIVQIPAKSAFNKLFNKQLIITYHGKPREAKKAPWDGGWVWSKDKLGRPFISVACQGLGASSWFPCKDIQSDEPDNGASLTIIVPDSLVAVGNGRLISKVKSQNLTTTQQENTKLQTSYTWEVKNPINSYTIIPSIGNYVNISDTFQGEKGILDLNYWVLDYNKEKAQEQFQQVKPMLKAFEYWFGPYPFYEDGYKLVETPFLGMEHQSAIAYGNNFMNGYRGRDLSGSGWGLKWDFIIVHESGHEWYANSITTKDIADMWVHEGFTNYSETLFTEYYYGKEAGNDYCYGIRKNIANDKPIIGVYGVNNIGSGDMYYKAANMIHGIRNALNDDEKFRKILRKMNEVFYHQTVTTQQIEQFLIDETGLDLQKTFDQYLRTTQIPTLEYYFKGRRLFTKFTNCIDKFTIPLTILPKAKTISPTTSWKKKRLNKVNKEWFSKEHIERLYLINVVNVPKP